jgi:hypothetical protein
MRKGFSFAVMTAIALSGFTTVVAEAAANPATALSDTAVCPAPHPGHMACMSRVLLQHGARYRPNVAALRNTDRPRPNFRPFVAGYTPADIQSAYRLSATGGTAVTVAVVDAFHNVNAASDLATYRTTWGLSSCTEASHCLTRLDEFGGTIFPGAPSAPAAGWLTETVLDLEAVSAACPTCHLILIEANSDTNGDLLNGVEAAVDAGANVISLSWGGPEFSAETTQDQVFNHPGVAITASAGDNGFGTSYPAASPYVTAVGGTTLSPSGGGWAETVWSGTGSGCSAFETKPGWQADSGCPRRMLNDTAAVADPATGLAIFDTHSGGWTVVGGTSLSSPVVGGFYAQNGGEGGSSGAAPVYQKWRTTDVTTGSNGSCPPANAYFCNGKVGYDGPTGVGTPLLSGLAPTVGVVGDSTTTQQGSNVTFTVTVSGSGATPSGSVSVYDGNIAIGTHALSSGSGSVSTTRLSGSINGGVHTITANYTGDGNYQGRFSTSPIQHTVVAQTYSAVTYTQPTLTNSDGTTWTLLDPAELTITLTPAQNEKAVAGVNADLFTSVAGFNQDIGICFVQGTTVVPNPCPLAQLLTWKESGGFAGTFSPNAADAEGTAALQSGVAYAFGVAWKTNHSGSSKIWAGAGPLGDGTFSPTRLTVRTIPNAGNVYDSHVTTQRMLSGSDGSTWQPMGISVFVPGSTANALLTGNADLFTSSAGFNQDVALFVSVDGGASQLLAWKESGGFAGTFSPNAALVTAPYTLNPSHAYVFSLSWKANKSDSGTIWAGAGPLSDTTFSPTRIVVQVLPSYAGTLDTATVTQPQLSGSNGVTWSGLGPFSAQFTAALSSDVVIYCNSDLWTSSAGYNQDIGVFISQDGGTFFLAGWKESGGFAGTFSPNAAAIEFYGTLPGGHTYIFSLGWKSNRSDPGTIWAGGGPIAGNFSPTRLTVESIS